MPDYPDYVYQMLARARDEGQWYCGQPDAAALCFDVLALFPDCGEASDLVYDLFCDEWLIYDNRNAVQQNIDEWDDRPHQQRRRLALSFRFMSRWEGWDREYVKGYKVERTGPRDVAKLLHQGHMMMKFIDPNAPTQEEMLRYAREQIARHGTIAKSKPVIDPQLAALFAEVLPAETDALPAKTIVDWSFLDQDDGQPGELPEWAKKQIRLFPKQAKDIEQMHRWSRPIKPPATPPRRDPNEPLFNPTDVMPDESDLDELDSDDEIGFADDDEIPF